MSVAGNGTACGLPKSLDIARNDTAFYINFIFLSAVNGSCAVFAFFSNLAIILTVIKVPSLKKRSNTLLCSLAFADCLTGILTQPAFIAWRFFLRSAPNSCSNQLLFLNVYQFFNALSVGLSFVNVVIISFDRHYAISRPLEYAARATQGGAVKIAIFASTVWLLFVILCTFIFNVGQNYPLFISIALLFFVVPIVNYIRMLVAIRRPNEGSCDSVTCPQRSAAWRREKMMALNMWIITILLMVSLTPWLFVKVLEQAYPRLHSFVLPWATTVTLMTSCVNPLIYFGRNKNFRNALKTLIKH